MSEFIAIEGGDGSGKETHSLLLREFAIEQLGRDALYLSFPRYGEQSAAYVERYLNGDYGAANDVHPELASLAYMLDRVATKQEIEAHKAKPSGLVIANRYVASNLAHQGTKYHNEHERRAFYEQTLRMEHEVLGVPQPDTNIVLLMPSQHAQANVDKKGERSYTVKKRDIHEADAGHLDRAKANYAELCELYPERFTAIDCMDGERMRDIDDIQDEIRAIITEEKLAK